MNTFQFSLVLFSRCGILIGRGGYYFFRVSGRERKLLSTTLLCVLFVLEASTFERMTFRFSWYPAAGITSAIFFCRVRDICFIIRLRLEGVLTQNASFQAQNASSFNARHKMQAHAMLGIKCKLNRHLNEVNISMQVIVMLQKIQLQL